MTSRLHVAEDILPVGEVKSRLSRVLKRLREDRRAVVITQHGRPAGVIVAPEEYDRLQERERFVAAVEEGLSDVEAGRVITDEELSAVLDREFPPPSSG